MTQTLQSMAIVGTGVMGAGIAQIAVQAGLQVALFDARPGAADAARLQLGETFEKLVAKGKISQADAAVAMSRLRVETTASWSLRPLSRSSMPSRICSRSWKRS